MDHELKLGLQLYSVGDELRRDFLGTLRRVAEIGFSQVEVAFEKRPAAELRAAFEAENLECRSAHFAMPELLADADACIAFAAELGVRHAVCSVPWVRDASQLRPDPEAGPFAIFFAAVAALTLDDWKWNAGLLNGFGERFKAAGIQLNYHNHNFEFREFDGVSAYEYLLRHTDPGLVGMEFDCGWAAVAGENPLDYLTSWPKRYRLLHLRDFQPGFVPSTEMRMTSPELLGPAIPAVIGTGIMDYAAILPAAADAAVESCFVERDPFYAPAPMLGLVQADYNYLRKFFMKTKAR